MRTIGIAIVVFVACLGAGTASAADDIFDGSELHDIWIHINSRDWIDLRANYLSNTYYPCDFEWHGMKTFNAGCRSRGRSSRNDRKPGLLVEFDHYVGGKEFLGLQAIALDNLWQDPSMMKERLSMLLFDRMGLAAPRESNARLFIGGQKEFLGLYGVVEVIDKRFLAREYGNKDGYIYEYNFVDPYHFEDLGEDFAPYAQRFEPKTHEHESDFALYSPIHNMVRAILDADPARLEQDVAARLDIRGFIRELAIENFLSEPDGLVGYAGLSNFYLYRADEHASFHFIPWDKDLTFYSLNMPVWNNWETNVLTRKIYASPELRGLYLQDLLESTSAASWLEEEATREFAQIHDTGLADQLKPFTQDQFEQAADDVIHFFQRRAAIVQGLVANATASIARP